MIKFFHTCLDLFFRLIAVLIAFTPYILLFGGLYFIKYLIFPKLPFSIFIILLAISVAIYDRLKKIKNKD